VFFRELVYQERTIGHEIHLLILERTPKSTLKIKDTSPVSDQVRVVFGSPSRTVVGTGRKALYCSFQFHLF
jgi:hypothetical protein